MPGSVGGELHLIELQIDRRFAAEHGNGDAHPVLFDVQLLDDAAEARQRAVHDADRVADLVANDDLALFDAELNDLILRQGVGLVLPDVTNPVTPRTFLMIYQASSVMTIFTST